MTFTQRFTEILLKNDSNIAHEINKNVYKDLGLNISFIDISLDRDDLIRFLPKDKMNTVRFTADPNVSRFGADHDSLLRDIGFSHLDILNDNGKINAILNSEFKLVESRLTNNHPGHIFHLVEGEEGGRFVIYHEKTYQVLKPSKEIKYQDIKIGRFTRALLSATGFKFTDSELEKFVNTFSSNIKIYKNMVNDIELVEGEDIRKWYNQSNYLNKKGQLGSSCMRYEETQAFLDIYSKNPNKCKLAILKEGDKLIGRALVWTLDNGDTYLDRQYSNADNISEVFITYAIKNNMSYFNGYIRGEYDREPTIYYNGKVCDNDISVTVENHEFETYPYFDSLRYINDDGKLYTKTVDGEYYDLATTNGKRYRKVREGKNVRSI